MGRERQRTEDAVEQVRALISKAEADDEQALAKVRESCDHMPYVWDKVYGVRRMAETAWVRMTAGASFVAMHNALGVWLSRRWRLPAKGRRPGVPGERE